MTTPPPSKYDESQIQPLDPIQHIRKRPGMYVGGTDARALSNTLNLAIEWLLSWDAAGVGVVIHDDQHITLTSDSPAFDAGRLIWENPPLTYLEADTGIIWTPGRNAHVRYRDIEMPIWSAVQAVNALSTDFTAAVRWGGALWRQTYREGKKVSETERVRDLIPDEKTGIDVAFTPDFSIFEPAVWDADRIAARLQELAYLLDTHTYTLHDQRTGRHETFHEPDGLSALVTAINRDHAPLHPVIGANKTIEVTERRNTYPVHLAFRLQYHKGSESKQQLFANLDGAVMGLIGGTHFTGFKRGLSRALNDYVREVHQRPSQLRWPDLQRGLSAAIWLIHPYVSYLSQTRVEVMNPELRGLMEQLVYQTLIVEPAALEAIYSHLQAKSL